MKVLSFQGSYSRLTPSTNPDTSSNHNEDIDLLIIVILRVWLLGIDFVVLVVFVWFGCFCGVFLCMCV